MIAAHALRCLHPGCPRTPTAGHLCGAHASRRHPPVRATVLPRTPTVEAAYARAWADHDPTREASPREALRNRLGNAQHDLARAAARHSRAPSEATTDALDAALSRVYGAVIALREVV